VVVIVLFLPEALAISMPVPFFIRVAVPMCPVFVSPGLVWVNNDMDDFTQLGCRG
jgi:hypothetical protein